MAQGRKENLIKVMLLELLFSLWPLNFQVFHQHMITQFYHVASLLSTLVWTPLSRSSVMSYMRIGQGYFCYLITLAYFYIYHIMLCHVQCYLNHTTRCSARDPIQHRNSQCITSQITKIGDPENKRRELMIVEGCQSTLQEFTSSIRRSRKSSLLVQCRM